MEGFGVKRCKVCRQPFEPRLPMQAVCGIDCARALAISVRGKAEKQAATKQRKLDRERKEAIKTRSDLAREAQREVNRYVRARDFKDGCISCDKPATWNGQWHASHFRSVGAAPQLRFNLWNIHKACSVCNNWKSGNIGEYAPRLLQKIGQEKYQFLLSHSGCIKYNREYLVRLKQVFARKANRQERRNEMLR